MAETARKRTSSWSSRSWLIAEQMFLASVPLALVLHWDARGTAIVWAVVGALWLGLKTVMRGLEVVERVFGKGGDD